MSKGLTWKDFIEQCNNCTVCDLHRHRQNVVVYRGNIRAPLMIVGEGPDKTEDETGIPFTGAAGHLLNLLLKAFDISMEYYHICNIVKCRPPGNRVPTKEESDACKPLFATQFKFVKPKIILLMGATAFKNFTGSNEGITKVRGQWIEKSGYYILPTLHPAYILRNNNARIDLWNDIETARNKMEDLGLIPPMKEPAVMPQGRKEEG